MNFNLDLGLTEILFFIFYFVCLEFSVFVIKELKENSFKTYLELISKIILILLSLVYFPLVTYKLSLNFSNFIALVLSILFYLIVKYIPFEKLNITIKNKKLW